MAITRLALETELSVRDGALLTFVGKSAAATGANPDYGSAIGFAAQLLGVTATTPGAVADSDLAALEPGQFYTVADLAEFRLLKTCLMGFTLPNEQAQDRRQDWATLRAQYQAAMDALQKQYAALLNIRQNPTVVGKGHFRFPTPNSLQWGIGRGRYDH